MSDATHFSAGSAYNVAFCGPFEFLFNKERKISPSDFYILV